jgi:pimeloyl-ACP methyl ester carboxylesterase
MSAVFAPEAVTPSMRKLPVEQAVRPDTPLAMARDLQSFNLQTGAICRQAGHLTVPTVILAGTADSIIDSIDHATWLAHRAPDIAVVKIAGAGHMLHHTHATLVMNAIRMIARRAAWTGLQTSLA